MSSTCFSSPCTTPTTVNLSVFFTHPTRRKSSALWRVYWQCVCVCVSEEVIFNMVLQCRVTRLSHLAEKHSCRMEENMMIRSHAPSNEHDNFWMLTLHFSNTSKSTDFRHTAIRDAALIILDWELRPSKRERGPCLLRTCTRRKYE